MNDSNQTEYFNKVDLILAGTLFAAVVGYMLFKPRRAIPQQDSHSQEDIQVRPGVRVPALIAPLSPTVH